MKGTPTNDYDVVRTAQEGYVPGISPPMIKSEVIISINDALQKIATSTGGINVQDTRLDNIEAALADIIIRLAAIEKATKITPAPSPKPKPEPKPKPIPVPDIDTAIVTPVDPIKPDKKVVKKTQRRRK
jgi:hypothetical protein